MIKITDVLNWNKESKICEKVLTLNQQGDFYDIPLKNIKVKDDLLTCILDNKENTFIMQRRKANAGELIYIIKTENMCDFCKRNLYKCFEVLKSCSETEWTRGYILINGGRIVDGQYVVLIKLKNKQI